MLWFPALFFSVADRKRRVGRVGARWLVCGWVEVEKLKTKGANCKRFLHLHSVCELCGLRMRNDRFRWAHRYGINTCYPLQSSVSVCLVLCGGMSLSTVFASLFVSILLHYFVLEATLCCLVVE